MKTYYFLLSIILLIACNSDDDNNQSGDFLVDARYTTTIEDCESESPQESCSNYFLFLNSDEVETTFFGDIVFTINYELDKDIIIIKTSEFFVDTDDDMLRIENENTLIDIENGFIYKRE